MTTSTSTPTTADTTVPAKDQLAALDDRLAVLRGLYETAAADAAGATAEADQAEAAYREALLAEPFDEADARKAQSRVAVARQRADLIAARASVLHDRGVELETRRNETWEQRRRAEHERAVREYEDEIRATNDQFIVDLKAAWAAVPPSVKASAGTSVLNGGSLWWTYLAKMAELRERAQALGASEPYVYGGGIIGLLVRQGELS